MYRLRLLPLVLLIAAAPVPRPLQDRLIAEAAAIPPAQLAFDRTSNSVRSGGGTTTKVSLVERWDGKQWTLLMTHGRKPTATERSDHKRDAKLVPVPGYHQLGPILAAATLSSVDANGRTVLLIPQMPANSVRTPTGDISAHLQGEAQLARRGDKVWVERLSVTEREAFKLNILIKVAQFKQISEYAPSSDGKPRLISQNSESKGSMFGFPGGETIATSFVYR
jgi:hypothetical protein